MLTCENITFYREEKIILQNISFTLLPGCLMHIKGLNGSGKTTLLRIIARFIDDHEGCIRYNQVDVNDAPDEYFSLIRYIPSQGLINMEFTVIEQLKLWAYLCNSKNAIEAAITTLNLHKVLNDKISSLSLGYQQRLRLSLLLLSHATLWLLDEPFNSLDQSSLEILYNMIEARRVQGGIVIYSNHQSANLKNQNVLSLEDFNKQLA